MFNKQLRSSSLVIGFANETVVAAPRDGILMSCFPLRKGIEDSSSLGFTWPFNPSAYPGNEPKNVRGINPSGKTKQIYWKPTRMELIVINVVKFSQMELERIFLRLPAN